MLYIEKNWSLVLFCISILTLGSALIAEHFFNLAPCDMCLKQRHPYYALIVLVVLFYLFKKNNHILLLLLVELLILYGLFYAIWHVGIENHLLTGPMGCSNIINNVDNIEELKSRLKAWQLKAFIESYKSKQTSGLSLIKKKLLETRNN